MAEKSPHRGKLSEDEFLSEVSLAQFQVYGSPSPCLNPQPIRGASGVCVGFRQSSCDAGNTEISAPVSAK